MDRIERNHVSASALSPTHFLHILSHKSYLFHFVCGIAVSVFAAFSSTATQSHHVTSVTTPKTWKDLRRSDPSGSFLAALVSFKVSSDVEPPAPQVKSVKSGPSASSATKSQSRPGLTGVHQQCIGNGQCASGHRSTQKFTFTNPYDTTIIRIHCRYLCSPIATLWTSDSSPH